MTIAQKRILTTGLSFLGLTIVVVSFQNCGKTSPSPNSTDQVSSTTASQSTPVDSINKIQFVSDQFQCKEFDCAMPAKNCTYSNPQFDGQGCLNSCGILDCSDGGSGLISSLNHCKAVQCPAPTEGFHYEKSNIDTSGCSTDCGVLVANVIACEPIDCNQPPPPPHAVALTCSWVSANTIDNSGCLLSCGGSWLCAPVVCPNIECATPASGMHYGAPPLDQNGCPVNCGTLSPIVNL